MATDSYRQSIGVLGDCMVSRALQVYKEPNYLKIREVLTAADAVFANFESSCHTHLDDPFAQRNGGGSYITTEPQHLEGLKWFGVNIVASGSSHADDYGPKGYMDTSRYLDAAGIVHAGAGRHLAEARSPAYLDTANGRIGLVAATAQFRPGIRAGDQRSDTLGWPGVNAVRHKVTYTVDKETLDQLRSVGKKIGWEMERTRRKNQGDPEKDAGPSAYDLLGEHFEIGDKFGIKSTVNKSDLEENMRMVRAARYFSDRVIVSLHVHDQGGPTLMTAERRTEVEDMADFAIDFARKAVDNGADIVVMHGPQCPMAVEIYKGKPIFHGMGAFVFQIETMRFLPAEAYERYNLDSRSTPAEFLEARYGGGTRGHTGNPLQWEQMFAVCNFAGDEFKEARLYPIDLGHQGPRTRRGRPMMADATMGKRILDRVGSFSTKYSTKVKQKDGIGIVTP
jgi:poly-gamma-glutamate capsule biosynthesis protein CapA/YwtB (metallophosphatase superfamily)